MGFQQVYLEGQPVRHSASREMAISALLNRFAPSGGSGQSAFGFPYNRVPVINSTGKELKAGSPVQLADEYVTLSEGSAADYVFRLEAKAAPGKPFGVLLSALKKGESGHAVFAGIVPATVSVKNEDHWQVKLNESGELETCESGGDAVLLWRKSGSGLLLLGGAPGGGASYRGGFALSLTVDNGDQENKKTTLTVAAGFARVNGKGHAVEGKSFPVSGPGCVMLTCEREKTPELSWQGSRTGGTVDKSEILIGRVVRTGDAYEAIQEQHGDVETNLWRTCKDDGTGEEESGK